MQMSRTVQAPQLAQLVDVRVREDREGTLCLRDAETTILIKFAFWRGLGKFYGKLSPNAVFPGKFHDN